LKAWSQRYALFVFFGFLALAVALGYGSMADGLMSPNPLLVALRLFGVGLMASGLALWIALLRDEAGKPGLNPLLGMMALGGVVLLLIRLLVPGSGWSELLSWGGLGMAIGSLIIGAVSMIVSPAYPRPLTARWPEGGETPESQHVTTSSH